MMDDKIFILQLRKHCNYPFSSAEVGKFYCIKIHRGLSPQGIDCFIVEWVGKDTPPAYVGSMDWVRYYFNFP